MIERHTLAILPVAVPLLVAAFLAGAGKRLPRRVADVVSLLAAASATCASAALLRLALDAPFVEWFGGFAPRAGVALGIGFSIDVAGAALATFVAALATVAFVLVFSLVDGAHAHLHALLLVFTAALSGFVLTGDLFNQFVFLELMTTCAIALTAHASEDTGPLQGALHLAVTNTIAAFLVLWGIALLYGRTGALNLLQIGRALAADSAARHLAHPDALVIAAFVLVTGGFAVKAAIVPVHFWLPDAHAAAPTPVSVLFSGIMVEAALYAAIRVYGAVFAPVLGAPSGLRALLALVAAVTCVVGALLAFAQQHLKRLLAFSTIAHVGGMLAGASTLETRGVAGAATYLLGHGCVKAALFVLTGILLHRFRSVDEIALRGRGRQIPLVGALFFLGALGVAGMPPLGVFAGEAHVHDALENAAPHATAAALRLCLAAGSLVTGAAVLRAAFRIFFALGPAAFEVPDIHGEKDERPETSGERDVPASMVLCAVVLLAAGAVLGLAPSVSRATERACWALLDGPGEARWALDGQPAPVAAGIAAATLAPSDYLHAVFRSLGAAALALVVLERRRLPAPLAGAVSKIGRGGARLLLFFRKMHGGRIGDSVALLVFALALYGAACAFIFR